MYGPKFVLLALALLATTVVANPLEKRCGQYGASCSVAGGCCANYFCNGGAFPRCSTSTSLLTRLCRRLQAWPLSSFLYWLARSGVSSYMYDAGGTSRRRSRAAK
jgi:hypothetical protein